MAPSGHLAVLVAVYLILAVDPALSEICGPLANGLKCVGANTCCSVWGYCGTGTRFCANGRCYSGACQGKPAPSPLLPPLRHASAGEGGTARAACPKGQQITTVISPFYGNSAKKCKLASATRIINSICYHRSSCAVPATDGRFGRDPCPGAAKTLSFFYRCGIVKPINIVKLLKPTPKPKPKPKPASQPHIAASPSTAYYSAFFGKQGERWSPTARLADWSYAGYMGNLRGLPYYPVKYNVRSFGAKGDGVADDTKAFQQALQAASAAAYTINTFDCSTKYRQKRCLRPHDGWQNGGVAGVAVLVPAGTYKITQILTITQSNVVLRGASKTNTILYFPRPLGSVYGPRQAWSFGSGFLIIDGNNAGNNQEQYSITSVTRDAFKGYRRIHVASAKDIQIGQWVRLYALAPSPARRRHLLQTTTSTATLGGAVPPRTNTTSSGSNAAGSYLPLPPVLQKRVAQAALSARGETDGDSVSAAARLGTLDAYLYGDNLVDSGTNAFAGTDHIRFPSKVVAKGSDWIELERPLPYNLLTRWQVRVYRFYATVQHSGIEALTLKFPWDVYPAHLKCKGYNAIELSSVANCWVRSVDVINADNGIFVTQSDFVSVRYAELKVEKARWSQETFPDNGHHALAVGRSGDVSFRFFSINSRYMHDLSVDGFAERNVFASGQGVDMNIDCHRAGTHNNLFTYLRLGKATRPFDSGGNEDRGAHSGANNTFWNVAPSAPRAMVPLPPCDFGALLNFAGSYLPPEPPRRGRRRTLLAAAATGRNTTALVAAERWAGDGDVVSGASATDPLWCTRTKWRVNVVPSGRALLPSNLFTAMIDMRQRRLARG